MAFPFVAPIDPWLQDVLRGRENNRHLTTFKNPYAILISTAKVQRAIPQTTSEDRIKELKKILEEPNSENSYNGCIIANHGNTEIKKHLEVKYASDRTVVGIDFSGKPIRVTGERGRVSPTPMIENIDIDTDGSNNTLKTATISVRCFTLKQLEMFELFYMKPGMSVLLEFGDSTLLNPQLLETINTKPNEPQSNKNKLVGINKDGKLDELSPFTTLAECLFYNKHKTFEDFCQQFTNVFRMSKGSSDEYNKTVARSLGSYDRVAGLITDYGFTIETDGTYLVTLELTQANQFSLAVALGSGKSTSAIKTYSEKISKLAQIKNKIAVDFKLDEAVLNNLMKSHPNVGGNWEHDFFNFFPTNSNSKDDQKSTDAYISLRFILAILLNYNVSNKNIFEIKLPTYNLDGKDTHIIPVQSNKYVISSTDDIIYPTNELPAFAPISDISEPVNTPIQLKKETVDGRIFEYNFHIKNNTVVDLDEGIDLKSAERRSTIFRLGDALNIFLKYDTIYKYWNDSTYKLNFLEKIFSLINMNSYGLIGLQYAPERDGGDSVVMDYKLNTVAFNNPLPTTEPQYRFQVGRINSNVKTFSFNFEMGNLIAARTIFNSSNFLKSLKNNKKLFTDKTQLDHKIIEQVDYSTWANADGYFSINYNEYITLVDRVKQESEFIGKGLETNTTDETTSEEDKPTEADLLKVIKDNSKTFDSPITKRDVVLIYKDKYFINTIIDKSNEGIDPYTGEPIDTSKKQKPTLTDIEVTLTMDGISGFRSGQYFNVNGVPEIYNQIGIFQITNIKHSITKDNGWETTIVANFRIQDINL